MVKKVILKIAILAFIFSLGSIGFTRAEFIDNEIANTNLFSVSTLDFSLSSGSGFSPQPLLPGETVARAVMLTNVGLLIPKYNVTVAVTNGNDYFCSNLHLEAKSDGFTVYSGRLVDLMLSPWVVFGGTEDNWEFTLSLISPDTGYQNQTCEFNFIFRGWQEESDGSWGLGDEEVINISVASGSWTASAIVLNEILPDPVGNDDADKPGGEWVELYNNSDATVVVENWRLTDAGGHSVVITAARTNTGGTSIAGHGFLVIYTGTSALTLNNGGDTINLYSGAIDPLNLVDSHTYSAVAENKSVARIPDGTGPWIDPIPTPGGPNVLEEPVKEPEVNFRLTADKKKVSFEVKNVKAFSRLAYEIVYDTETEEKGIFGAVDLGEEEIFSRENLVLGSCSSLGEVCTYDQGITKIHLKVVLDEGVKILEKEINY